MCALGPKSSTASPTSASASPISMTRMSMLTISKGRRAAVRTRHSRRPWPRGPPRRRSLRPPRGDAGRGDRSARLLAIAHDIAGAQVADVEDRSGERSHGPQPFVRPLQRAAAEERHPGPHEVEAVFGTQERARRRRETGAGGLEQRPCVKKHRQLPGILEDYPPRTLSRDGSSPIRRRGPRSRSMDCATARVSSIVRPLAVHAGVDVEGDAQGPAGDGGLGGGRGDLRQVGEAPA